LCESDALFPNYFGEILSVNLPVVIDSHDAVYIRPFAPRRRTWAAHPAYTRTVAVLLIPASKPDHGAAARPEPRLSRRGGGEGNDLGCEAAVPVQYWPNAHVLFTPCVRAVVGRLAASLLWLAGPISLSLSSLPVP